MPTTNLGGAAKGAVAGRGRCAAEKVGIVAQNNAKRCKRKNNMNQRVYYSLFLESIQIETGPSFKSDTFMSAPNVPVQTRQPDRSANVFTKDS